jgi:pimeloyl-ACP methyl ester carboxylesterase
MKVLVVHGMFCTAWHTAALVDELCAAGLDAVGLELPGRGEGALGLRDHVTFVKDRAVSSGDEGAVALVGHSMGGLIALLAAAELADRPWLRRLALMGCAPPAGVNGFNLANLPAFLPAVLGPGARHLMPRRPYERLFMNCQGAELRLRVRRMLVSEPRSLIRSIALPALDHGRAARPRFACEPRFESLVLAGAGDRSTPPRVQEAIAGLLPGARYECLSKPDHYGFIEGNGSGETLSILAEFLGA